MFVLDTSRNLVLSVPSACMALDVTGLIRIISMICSEWKQSLLRHPTCSYVSFPSCTGFHWCPLRIERQMDNQGPGLVDGGKMKRTLEGCMRLKTGDDNEDDHLLR